MIDNLKVIAAGALAVVFLPIWGPLLLLYGVGMVALTFWDDVKEHLEHRCLNPEHDDVDADEADPHSEPKAQP